MHRFGHLTPEEAARIFRLKCNPPDRRRASIDNLFGSLECDVKYLDSQEWPHPEDMLGCVDPDGKIVEIKIGFDVPHVRQRFTSAHEAGHIALDHRATFGAYLETIPRRRAKMLSVKGLKSPLRDQWYFQDEQANAFAEAYLAPWELVCSDKGNHTLPELCEMYGVSRWTMICSLVRATPEPCLALAFTERGPVAPIRANKAAVNSGLFTYILRKFQTRRMLGDWQSARITAESEREFRQKLNIHGFVINEHCFPAPGDHCFFIHGRNEPVKVAAIYTQDTICSEVDRIAELSDWARQGKLYVAFGPPGVGGAQKALEEIMCKHRISQDARVYGVFGDTDEDWIDDFITDRTGIQLLEKIGADTKTIVVNDVQFCRREFFHVVRMLLDQGKDVIAIGSVLNCHGELYEITAQLKAIANDEIPFTTQCQWPGCNHKATRSQLVATYPGDISHVLTTKDIIKPVCEKHWVPAPLAPKHWPNELFAAYRNFS